jgi:WD40 repeat protein
MKKFKANPFICQGPSSDIPLAPEHGGPALCMDVQGDIVVTGSTDHGLRVYSLQTGKQHKELFSKTCGHTEWVTCCTFLPDNRIVSGGMDSNICVWQASGVKCKFITEHTGSISKLVADASSTVLSSSYDSSVRIFDMNSVTCQGTLKGVHKGPVTEFEWKNSLCVTAGRDGQIALWDINTERCLQSQVLHKGQVGRVKFHTDELDTNLILSAGMNDGVLNGIDMRTSKLVFQKRIHAGAINFLETNRSNLVITGSADKTVKVLDLLDGLKEIGNMKATDSVFCGDIYENFVAVGCGDGNLLGYNLDTMECLYGYGCDNKGGIKCLKILPEKGKIVTSGDAGEGLQLVFT